MNMSKAQFKYKKICFFSNMKGHENWHEMFKKIEFYNSDIQILEELGYEVILANRYENIDWSADLIYCWWWGYSAIPVFVSRILGKPCIVTGAFDYASCRAELPGLCYLDRPKWQKLVIDYVLRNATASLFVSKYEFEEVSQNLRVKRPELVPHGVDTNKYIPLATTDYKSNYFFSLSWTSTTNVIRKGVRQTIEAFARIAPEMPGVRLKLAGKPGDHHAKLQELVRDLGIHDRVDFLGMISDEEKLDHYQRCLAYVQPTLYEGFGLAIAEAIACGAPVITSQRGAVPEVAGVFGSCVDPHDVGAIANEMRNIFANPPTVAYKLAAHNWINQMYSLDARRNHLKGIIGNLLKKENK
jgi:glycosyltransferase involved in cell wall biosynthesis